MKTHVTRIAFLMFAVVLVLAAFLVGPPSPSAKTDSGVPSAVWSLKGNRGTDPASDFLGTSDNQPLIIRTNSTPALTVGSEGPVEIDKMMVVHGETTIDNDTQVGGDLAVLGDAQIAKNANIVGSLTADGASHIGGVTLSGGAVQATSVNVAGATTFSTLTVTGTTRTGVLEITGGDVAEPFNISASLPVPDGAVVVIDESNPGNLRLSDKAYDSRVAGVISGAGGIKTGLLLFNQVQSNKTRSVALTGRAYALADASNGSIKPGDLLTTSAIPGHLMKVTDHNKSQGAVLGKAMSSLDKGQGLVLVLVNLQ